MIKYDAELALRTWRRVPVEGRGNLDSAELLKCTSRDLRRLARDAAVVRYRASAYAAAMGLEDDGENGRKIVLDLGCGFGLDALRYAQRGWRVILTDLVPENVELASVVMRAHDLSNRTLCGLLLFAESPHGVFGAADRIHASGSLHHTPRAASLLAETRAILKPGGEVRALLYSDHAWRKWTKDPRPDPYAEATTHPRWWDFVVGMDGNTPVYADWYDERKARRLAEAAGLELASFGYLPGNEDYVVARMGLL